MSIPNSDKTIQRTSNQAIVCSQYFAEWIILSFEYHDTLSTLIELINVEFLSSYRCIPGSNCRIPRTAVQQLANNTEGSDTILMAFKLLAASDMCFPD